jgi:hypothetical protein
MRKSAGLLFAAAVLLFLARPVAAQGDVKAIVDKAIKAHGGEEKLTKLKATRLKAKGTMSAMGADIAFTLQAANMLPDKVQSELKLEVMGQTIPIIQVYDGKKGWVSAMGEVKELEGDELKEMKDQAFGDYLDSIVPLKTDKKLKIEKIADEMVEGKAAVGLKISSEGHKEVKMFFDKESGLLVKAQKRTKDPAMQEVNADVFYLAYKDVEGVKVAMKQLVKHDGKKFVEVEVTEVKLLEKLDDSVFAKP